MKKLITGTRGLLAAITIVGLVFGLAGYSEAGYKTVIDGISVSYSKDGANAYYDEEDGTLTVAIGEDGGALKISVRDGQDLSDNLQKILSGSPLLFILHPSRSAVHSSRHHQGSCHQDPDGVAVCCTDQKTS
jgi:hypothetical protein